MNIKDIIYEKQKQHKAIVEEIGSDITQLVPLLMKLRMQSDYYSMDEVLNQMNVITIKISHANSISMAIDCLNRHLMYTERD